MTRLTVAVVNCNRRHAIGSLKARAPTVSLRQYSFSSRVVGGLQLMAGGSRVTTTMAAPVEVVGSVVSIVVVVEDGDVVKSVEVVKRSGGSVFVVFGVVDVLKRTDQFSLLSNQL